MRRLSHWLANSGIDCVQRGPTFLNMGCPLQRTFFPYGYQGQKLLSLIFQKPSLVTSQFWSLLFILLWLLTFRLWFVNNWTRLVRDTIIWIWFQWHDMAIPTTDKMIIVWVPMLRERVLEWFCLLEELTNFLLPRNDLHTFVIKLGWQWSMPHVQCHVTAP